MSGSADAAKKRSALGTLFRCKRSSPEAPERGSIISGIEKADKLPDVKVFHAGTALKDEKVIANGGRVLNVTATGKTVKEAQQKAYQAIKLIDWPEGFYRHDIGWRAIEREESKAN